MNQSKNINLCRLCNHANLKSIIDFGSIPLGNNFAKSRISALNSEIYKLNLVMCLSCKHFQLNFEVSPIKLYATNYTYLSGVAHSFIKHFDDYSNWIIKKCEINAKNMILDIGSNDGTCLNAFKTKNINVLGIDPAKAPARIANKRGIKTINAFFNKKSSLEIKKKYGEIDFITSHNVLAHIGNIQEVFLNIFYLLKNNGYFCFEVGYFLEVLKNNYFDTIYHEHLDYHHAAPLVKHLSSIGFSVINISKNKIQGGSIRILCQKKDNVKIYVQPLNFLQKESKSIINNGLYLKKWSTNISNNMSILNTIINDLSRKNLSIIGYGAPTKATLILKLAKLRKNLIKFIVEDNSLKVNKYMPKTMIKIQKYDRLNVNKSDVIIIFAWNFFLDIINKLKKDKISNKIIIVPLPKVKIYRI